MSRVPMGEIFRVIGRPDNERVSKNKIVRTPTVMPSLHSFFLRLTAFRLERSPNTRDCVSASLQNACNERLIIGKYAKITSHESFALTLWSVIGFPLRPCPSHCRLSGERVPKGKSSNNISLETSLLAQNTVVLLCPLSFLHIHMKHASRTRCDFTANFVDETFVEYSVYSDWNKSCATLLNSSETR